MSLCSIDINSVDIVGARIEKSELSGAEIVQIISSTTYCMQYNAKDYITKPSSMLCYVMNDHILQPSVAEWLTLLGTHHESYE